MQRKIDHRSEGRKENHRRATASCRCDTRLVRRDRDWCNRHAGGLGCGHYSAVWIHGNAPILQAPKIRACAGALLDVRAVRNIRQGSSQWFILPGPDQLKWTSALDDFRIALLVVVVGVVVFRIVFVVVLIFVNCDVEDRIDFVVQSVVFFLQTRVFVFQVCKFRFQFG